MLLIKTHEVEAEIEIQGVVLDVDNLSPSTVVFILTLGGAVSSLYSTGLQLMTVLEEALVNRTILLEFKVFRK